MTEDDWRCLLVNQVFTGDWRCSLLIGGDWCDRNCSLADEVNVFTILMT